MSCRKKHLHESIYENKEQAQAVAELLGRCVALHPEEEYAELGVLLGMLHALSMIHQAHHWQTMGPEFYTDHLLFQTVYGGIGAEIDSLAEKIVGVGGIKMTNYFFQLSHMGMFMDAVATQQPLADESLLAEVSFVLCGEIVMDRLEKKGILTRGIEQTLGTFLEGHEKNIYLLQQRVTR